MDEPNWIRFCGLALILGGILEIGVRIPQFTYFGDQPLSVMAAQPGFTLLLGAPSLAAGILILLGLTGVQGLQARQTSAFSWAAFILAFVGITLSTGANWTYAFVAPILAHNAPSLLAGDPAGQGLVNAILASYLSAQVGLLVLGIAMLRVGVFPRWVALTLIGSILLLGGLFPLADTQGLRFLYNALVGTGPVVVGIHLWRRGAAGLEGKL